MKHINRIITALLIFGLCISNIGYISVNAAPQSKAYSQDELIIKLKDNANVSSVMSRHKGNLKRSNKKIKFHKIKLPKGAKLEDKIKELKNDPSVEYVSYEYKYQAFLTPNDPSYKLQWGLPKIKADKAWDISIGNNSVIVAVVDTGVDSDHPDLANNIISGYNVIDGTIKAEDDQGHGTHVAGIAAGVINNSKGITGVSGKSKIMPVKVLDSQGSGWTSDIAEGIIWAADHGARVINLSLGGPSYDRVLEEAINYAYGKGSLVVAAAGNSNTSDPSYPAAYNNVVAVSAIDSGSNRASFSNYGTYVDITAPGVNIYSTTYDGAYGYKSGTSMACPFIAGAAALIWSHNVSMTPSQVESILESTAFDLGYVGKDANFGYGLVDVYGAITAAANPPATPIPTATPFPTSASVKPTVSPTPTPNLPPIGSIENPSDGDTITGIYNLNGWFLDGKIVTKIEVLVDGAVSGNAVTGDLRTDIGNKYPLYNNYYPGFHYSLDTSKLTNGSHSITVRETSLEGVKTTLPAINVNVANKPTSASIKYYLSENAYVTIKIHDSSDNLVKTLETKSRKAAGWNYVKWDGRNSTGSIVPDGVYTYKITAYDDVGLSTTKSGTLIIERLAPSITSVSDSPDPFIQGDTDESTIEFTISEDANVAVKLFDSAGTLKKTLVDKALKIGANKVTWDGTNDSGVNVSNGKYTYTIDAVDSFNKPAQQITGIITVGNSSLVISDNNVSPDPFTPTGTNAATVSYNLSADGRVSLIIVDSSNNTIKVLENNTLKNQGQNSASWDGKNSSGIIADEGSYAYKITAVDLSGLDAAPVSGIINISKADGDYRLISSIDDTPDPFMPDGSSSCSISYNLTENATVSVTLYNSSGSSIRSLTNATLNSGVNTSTWDGKDSSGKIVGNGVYTYVVSATGSGGKSQNASGTITVDASVPVISEAAANPNPFAPAVSNIASISYRLSENARTTVEIFNSSGNLVKTLESGMDRTAGPNSSSWDGKDSSGKIVVDGRYTFKISAFDYTGQEARPASGTIDVYGQSKPLISGVNDSPDPFKPDGKTYSTINFSLSSDSDISLNIYNDTDILVRSLLVNTLGAGDYKSLWDGRDDSGKAVSSGTYTYTIKASSVDGNRSQTVSGTVTIDLSAPVISANAVNPNPFTPTGSNMAVISYSLSEAAKTTVNIYDSSKKLVLTIDNGTQKNPGSNSSEWDGRDQAGVIVPQGSYLYEISAVDSSGMQAKAVTGTISVLDGRNSQGIVISSVNDSPDPFKPDGKTVNTISYTISKNATASINIYNSSGALVRSLFNGAVNAGGNKAVWDGRNNAGTTVTNGTFTYKINATDTNNNKAPEVSGTIVVDITAPVITPTGFSPDPFNPDGSTTGTLSYALSENAYVSAAIYNSAGSLVRTLESSVLKGSGANTSSWNGKNTSGSTVPDGTYTYRIDAVNAAGLKANTVTGTIVVKALQNNPIDNPVGDPNINPSPNPVSTPLITSASVSPDTIKPDSEASGSCNISFTLSAEAVVTAGIYNSSNALVKTLLNGTAAKGSKALTWDGKNGAGAMVGKGIYIYRINARDFTGTQTSTVRGTITVDFDLPTVTINSISSNPFESLGNNEVTVSYILSKKASVWAEIFSSSGSLVKRLGAAESKLSGVNTAAWDGKDSQGALAKDGAYTIKITASDFLVQQSSANGIINIAHTVPTITSVGDSPDPFKPGAAVSIIKYTLSKDASVSIQLYNENKNLVKTLLNATQKAGDSSITWDGKNSSGTYVPAGTYTYTIDAVDSLGYKALQAAGKITADLTAPAISDTMVNRIPFIPDGSDKLALLYSLSEEANVTIGIYDSSNQLIRTLESGGLKAQGNNMASWDGSSTDGKFVPEGAYNYVINAVDPAGNQAMDARGTIETGQYESVLPSTVLDFDDDRYFNPNLGNDRQTGSNITWNPEYGDEPKEVKEHRMWLNRKGIDVSGTPDGFVWTSKLSGSAGQTGVIIGLASPNHLEQNEGISDNEALSVNFINGPVEMAEIGLTTIPSNSDLVNNVYATVVLKAFDSTGNLVTSKTRSFMGVTGNKHTPLKVKLNAGSEIISKITIETTRVPYGGVWIESIGFKTSAAPELPVISDSSANPNPFTPDAAGSSSVVVSYSLSKEANVTVSILDSSNATVKVLEEGIEKSAGINSVSWNGYDASGVPVKEGLYTYRIEAVDEFGRPSNTTTGSITVDSNSIIKSASDTPDPFSPTGLNYSVITFELSETARVSIKLYDQSHNVVNNLVESTFDKGGCQYKWDGKDQLGSLVAGGTYTYIIDATGTVSGHNSQVSGTITVQLPETDKVLPVISAVSDSPDPFGADGTAVSTIKYTISKDSHVTIKIYDSANNTVKTLKDGDMTAGTASVTWDGKYDNGTIISDGTYKYIIEAVDSAGNKAVSITGSITSDATPPSIDQIGVDPAIFEPQE